LHGIEVSEADEGKGKNGMRKERKRKEIPPVHCYSY